MTQFLSDSHNFGQRVARIESPSGSFCIHKPRSCHLEFLFFSQNSPIKKFIESLSSGGLFAFQVNLEGEWSGEVEDVSRFLKKTPFDFDLKTASSTFSDWMFLSLIFGITDLHKENCFYLSNHSKGYFTPIDLESIFFPLTSAIDTGLFDKRREKVSIAGALGQLETMEMLDLSLVIDALLYNFTVASNRVEAIKIVWTFLKGKPIREIIRDTFIYRRKLGLLRINELSDLRAEEPSFTKEETIQLNRGDIPYFFHLHGVDEKLMYFSEPGLMSYAKDSFKLRNDKLSLEQLIDPLRIERLIKICILQCLRNFWSPEKKKVSGKMFEAEVKEKQFHFSSKFFNLQCSLA